jgi:prophage DNA circulation protein
MADRFPISIDGHHIEASTVSDGFESAIVEHVFLRSNGAQLENDGQTARRIELHTYWNGPNYEKHKAFLRDRQKPNLSEFTHPAYGPVFGMVKSARVVHDDGLDCCEIDITFIEDNSDLATFSAVPPTSTESIEQSFLSGQLQQMTLALGSLRGALHSLTALVEAGVATFEGTLSSFELAADAVVSTVDYGTSLPGRLVGAAANCAARIAVANQAVTQSPVALINSLCNAFRSMKATIQTTPKSMLTVGASADLNSQAGIILGQQFGLSAAQQLCVVASQIFDADEDGRNAMRQAENVDPWDMEGNYTPPPDIPNIMNVRELEHSLAMVRQLCQEQLGVYGQPDPLATREVPAIKDMCSALLSYVSNVKLEMEKIVDIDVEPALPLFVVCLRRGLPYRMADRIVSINDIYNPSFTRGKVSVYAAG